MERLSAYLAVVLLLGPASCSDGVSSPSETPEPAIALHSQMPATATAGEALAEEVVFRVADQNDAPLAGREVSFDVRRGGGSLSATTATTDADGLASVTWTLGVAPIPNALAAVDTESGLEAIATTQAERAEPIPVESFGGVHAFLTSEGIEGSTEGLAFDGDDRLVLAVPDAIVAIDAAGTPSLLELSRDTLVNPLGMGYDTDGGLWIADGKGAALRHVDRDGVITTALTELDGEPLGAPNGLTVGPDGYVYFSDPCLGEVISFDPATGTVVAHARFDLATQGGPNGMAFDRDGGTLWVATENTGILCTTPGVDPLEPVGGLFTMAVSDGALGAPVPFAENVGLFGDGIAFDDEDNLWAIFDTAEGIKLEESVIWVFPADGGEPRKAAVATDLIFANLAFGPPSFGETTLYVALLHVQGFVDPDQRGAVRLEVGVPGLPLLP